MEFALEVRLDSVPISHRECPATTRHGRRMPSGDLIVFEGPDGAGKSTIASNFTEYLTSFGNKTRMLSFPGREEGTLGWHIYQLHHDPSQFGIAGLTPESLQMLHVAAHLDAIDRAIRPLLQSGTSVVLDRYWWSTWVYGRESGAKAATLDAMINCERVHWGRLNPAMVFLVTRKDSLRPQDAGEAWRTRASLYLSLADETRDYPVQRLSNDGTERETLEAATTAWLCSRKSRMD